MLFSLAGDMPFSRIKQVYDSWCNTHGLPIRTDRALRRRLEDNGYSLRSVGEWLTTAMVAELIGTSTLAIARWCNNGWVTVHREGHRRYISRKSLRKLARQRPILFSGANRDNLFQLLEDDELVTSIRQQYPTRAWAQPVKVRCIQTGKVYPSIKSAALAVYVTPQAIRHAINRGYRTAEYNWERVA
jgi:hypothetical protein